MDTMVFGPQEKGDLMAQGVETLVLFGSRAQATAGPLSDFDFGVTLTRPHILYSPAARRALYDFLYDLLSSKIKKLINIDIVFLDDAPMELQAHTAKYGTVLYERTPHSFARFCERVINLSADFAPLRNLFHRAILSRIA